MEPSDESLVLACQRGEVAAWEALVDRYQRLIYTIARHAGLDEELAADAFQRVFANLVEHLHSIEQPAMIGAWLATTARHEAWRISRRERLARTAGEYDQLTDSPGDTVPPDEMLLRLEEQQQIRTAMTALDERCRRLLTALFYQPEPPAYSQIATMLGMSEGSIGPTRARCLQKLRRLLEQDS
jgi:RNA polymerase sigma factor (sigma-70 family)